MMRMMITMFFCIPARAMAEEHTISNKELFPRQLQTLSEKLTVHEEGDNEDNGHKANTEIGRNTLYDFLYKRLYENASGKPKKKTLAPNVYMIPGPQEPLPGRSHLGDYWPVFPFHNQFSGGLDLDPSVSRHIGGDMNIAVPSWGMLDIYGRFFNRIHDTTTKFGYLNQPVNMLDLDKEDFIRLMSDPSLQYNRNAQPRLPLGKLAKTYVPVTCKPPMCNPYHMNFGFGMEHDYGGNDGVEGDIDVPIPISKGVAYRFPFSGKIYAFRDNVTVTYGHNIAPIDPFMSMFEYQKHRDPGLAIPRTRRSVPSEKVWLHEAAAATYKKHLETNTKIDIERSAIKENLSKILLSLGSLAYTPFNRADEENSVFFNDLDQTYLPPVNSYLYGSHIRPWPRKDFLRRQSMPIWGDNFNNLLNSPLLFL
ncbi:hypothetical protein RB195_021066 [Necator americanus]|uniref:Uncharacterized protein n=1 Tax=Necator americanus TaxID=51031 RepID=A0ABR1E978_NECAM